MTYPHGLDEWLGLGWEGVLATIIATAAIYSLFLLITRLRGVRMLAGLTTFDTLMVLMFGGLIARTALGPVPTLATGVTAFLTLVILHTTLGHFANTRWGDAAINSSPRVLMAGAKMHKENMRRTNTTQSELMSALRTAGIRQLRDVAAVIMEPSGKLSIYRVGEPLDPEMLVGVKDAQWLLQKSEQA